MPGLQQAAWPTARALTITPPCLSLLQTHKVMEGGQPCPLPQGRQRPRWDSLQTHVRLLISVYGFCSERVGRV